MDLANRIFEERNIFVLITNRHRHCVAQRTTRGIVYFFGNLFISKMSTAIRMQIRAVLLVYPRRLVAKSHRFEFQSLSE